MGRGRIRGPSSFALVEIEHSARIFLKCMQRFVCKCWWSSTPPGWHPHKIRNPGLIVRYYLECLALPWTRHIDLPCRVTIQEFCHGSLTWAAVKVFHADTFHNISKRLITVPTPKFGLKPALYTVGTNHADLSSKLVLYKEVLLNVVRADTL